jgi:hypothetical protein
MTKKELLRTTTNKANEAKAKIKEQKAINFAAKVVNTKAFKKAEQGGCYCRFKVPKRYNTHMVVKALAEMGFDTTKSSYVNGKVYVSVSW